MVAHPVGTEHGTTALLGIDVGTSSARAAIFDTDGRLLGLAKQSIRTWYEAGGQVEQSSRDIWAAVQTSVRRALTDAGIAAADVAGIGVDATCSLAVVDPLGAPLAVGPSLDSDRNVIVWMDHRAIEQARRINATNHPVLAYVGGGISPEMQTPKLLWLKEYRQDTFKSAGYFFDLSDYLTWRLTGSAARSICTVTCKWTYLAHERRWDLGYFNAIGLQEIADEHYRIGTEIVGAGSPLGQGLSEKAASDLGLLPGTPVGAGLIDAHAGGIGTVGAEQAGPIEGSLAYILGTSACAMATTRSDTFVPGIWGPYFSAMVPDRWLNEAGQSAAGAAIDYLVKMHPAFPELQALAANEGLAVVSWLDRQATGAAETLSEIALRARSLHVVPDFNGNRSPFADPEACAVIAGLRADCAVSSLVDLYVAGLCGLGYELSQIIVAFRERGIPIERLIVSGGGAQSEMVRQTLADITELPVCVPVSPEPVLLGAAMLAAVAARIYPDLREAMPRMSKIDSIYRPAEGQIREFHRAKAEAFAALQKTERLTRSLLHSHHRH
jgi:D-ribulokinase